MSKQALTRTCPQCHYPADCAKVQCPRCGSLLPGGCEICERCSLTNLHSLVKGGKRSRN